MRGSLLVPSQEREKSMSRVADSTTLQNAYMKALEIIEIVGVRFEVEQALDSFKQAGARIEGETVYISSKLVEEALTSTPTCKPASGTRRVAATTPFSNAPFLLDEYTGKIRRCSVEDAIKFYKLNETSSLYENSNPGCADPIGNDTDDQFVAQIAMLLKYSDKVPSLGLRATVNTSLNGDVYGSARRAFRLAREFYDVWDEPVMSQGICPNPPLAYDRECLDNLRAAIDEKQAVSIIPCALGFLTGPESIMGLVIQDFALILAGLVYVQLTSPGHPISFNTCSTISNIQTMQPNYGGVESVYIQALFYELCSMLELSCSVLGSYSDGVSLDYQAGMESLLSALAPFSLTDLDEVWCSPGLLAGFACGSFHKAILDEEMIRNANRLLSGVDLAISPELSSFIAEGQTDGSFLSVGTMETYKRDNYLTSTFNKWGISSVDDEAKASLNYKAEKEIKERMEAYQQPERSASQKKLLQPLLPSMCRY